MKAILTYARGWNTLAAVRSLGKKGIDVVTADEYDFAPSYFSKYSVDNFRYPSPDQDPDGFIDTLLEQIEKHQPENGKFVLMPFHKETYLIAKHRDKLEPYLRVPVPGYNSIMKVHDKGGLAEYAMLHGIPIPKTYLFGDVAEVRDKAKEMTFPVFIKLRQSAAAVGLQKVDDARALIRVYDEYLEKYQLTPEAYPIVQEAVPGEDYCVTALFEHGTPKAMMTYHNLRTYPVKSGTGVLRETVVAPEIEEVAQALLSRLEWHGVAQLDFRMEPGKGTPWLIEVNPRFWGGLNQSIESGVDYPYLLFQMAVEGNIRPVTRVKTEVRTETPVMAFLATLHEIVYDESRVEGMKEALAEAKTNFRPGSRRSALRQLFRDLQQAAEFKDRFDEIRRLIGDHSSTVYDVLSLEDPLPVLGILYLLAIFIKHGRISTELLISEEVTRN